MENNRKSKANKSLGILVRVIKYMVIGYKPAFPTVLARIILSAAAIARGVLFIQSPMDDYTQPLLTQVAGMQAAGGQGTMGGQGAVGEQGTVGGQAALDFTPLFTALCGSAALYLVSILVPCAHNGIIVTVSQGTMKRLRIQLFERVESLPTKYFDAHAYDDTMSVYIGGVDTLRQLVNQSVPQVTDPAVTLVTTVISMLLLNAPLTLLTLAMACVILVIARCLSDRSTIHFGEQRKASGTVDGYIEEMVGGQKVVKVFRRKNQAMKEFEDLNERLRDSADKTGQYISPLMLINSSIGGLNYMLCTVADVPLALNGIGGIAIGAIVAFVGLSKDFTQPTAQISQQMNSVVMAAAGAERISELLDEIPEGDQGYMESIDVKEYADGTLKETDQRAGVQVWKRPYKQEGMTTYKKMEDGVILSGVDFGYDDPGMVLHDIKIFAKPGQKIAFIGSMGTGKTTTTDLINRFYNIQDGKVRCDGININKIEKPALRRSLGIILQNTHLFTDTVINNIRYGWLDATGAKRMNAARLANTDSFIRRLSDGYKTVLTGGGESLSQGQRQFLVIARATIADPPVLILDEAISSIDTRTKFLVQVGMDALMGGRTTFVIAHRFSIICDSGYIIVMEQGKVIERGSHDELIHRKGRHYQLYTGNLEEVNQNV